MVENLSLLNKKRIIKIFYGPARKLGVNEASLRNETFKFNRSAENSDYDGLQCWIRSFCIRHCLTYRKALHQSQPKFRDPDKELDTGETFILGLAKFAKDFPKSIIFNIDEAPAYFDMLSSNTLEFIGSKTVDLINTGHDKTRLTLIITIGADGKLLPIGVIFKGLKNKP